MRSAILTSTLLALVASPVIAVPMDLTLLEKGKHGFKFEHETGVKPHHGEHRFLPGRSVSLEARSIWSSVLGFFGKESGTIAKAGSTAAKDLTAESGALVKYTGKVGAGAISDVSKTAKTGMATWKKLAIGGGALVGGGLLLDHFVGGSGDAANTANPTCPGQGGDDSYPALTSDQLAQFQASASAGLSQWMKDQLLCFTPLTTKDYATVSGVVNSAPTLTPTDGGVFTDNHLASIESNICSLTGDDKSNYLSQILATPGIVQSEKDAVNAAANGKCPAS